MGKLRFSQARSLDGEMILKQQKSPSSKPQQIACCEHPLAESEPDGVAPFQTDAPHEVAVKSSVFQPETASDGTKRTFSSNKFGT